MEKLNDFGRPPKLVAILVGDDPASATYVTMKERACNSLGIKTEIKRLAEDTSTTELQQIIKDLNDDQTVDGILLQHPVPKQIDEIKCFNTICLEKDVDGVTTEGFGNMAMGLKAFGSCTPLGIMRILEHFKVYFIVLKYAHYPKRCAGTKSFQTHGHISKTFCCNSIDIFF